MFTCYAGGVFEASGLRGLKADVGFGFLNRTILKPIRKTNANI